MRNLILVFMLFALSLPLFAKVDDAEYIEKLSSSVLKDLEQMKIEIIEEYRNEKKMIDLELAHKELLLSRQKNLIRFYVVLFILILIFLAIVLNQSRHVNNTNRKLENSNDQLNKANEQLLRLATTDSLTNLSNRRDMISRIEHEQQRFARNQKPFVVIMADVDDFKMINDEYGHDGGDFVLTSIAYLMKSTVRKQDIVGRWGGEEFLLLLPETDLEGGTALAEKIRSNVAITPYLYSDNKIPVTITFGVTVYDRIMDMDDCIRISDRALYRGKRSGKNKVVGGRYNPDENGEIVYSV